MKTNVDTVIRYVGLNEHHQEPLTSGEIHTICFTSLSCSLPHLILKVWQRLLITTIVSWGPSVRCRMPVLLQCKTQPGRVET